MATIGLSKPYCAVYNFEDGVIRYSGGMVMGKAREMDISINTSTGNNLYGDNGIAESERTFSDGTLTLSTDELTQEVHALILGAKERELSGGAKELVFDDEMNAPYLGVGFIIKKKHRGIYRWRAVVLSRVLFNVPAEAAVTQGESIEWQVPTLTATILRDETDKHEWMRSAHFETEAEAENYIKAQLAIT